jgi:hypothetical protein
MQGEGNNSQARLFAVRIHDFILPSASVRAMAVSPPVFSGRLPITFTDDYATSNEGPVSPERLMQFGFAYAPPLIIGAAVKNKASIRF